jgi:hypothetical protein
VCGEDAGIDGAGGALGRRDEGREVVQRRNSRGGAGQHRVPSPSHCNAIVNGARRVN